MKCPLIQKLKNRKNRILIGISISGVIDGIFLVCYLIQFFLVSGNIWQFINALYYLLLLAGKVCIFLMGMERNPFRYVCRLSGILLLLLGGLALIRTYQYIKLEKNLVFSNFIYLLNGSLLLIRIVARLISKAVSPKKGSKSIRILNMYRNSYLWAENLIAFSILYSNVIEIYQWHDKDLILSNILQGQAVGAGIFIIGLYLLKTADKNQRLLQDGMEERQTD